MICLPFGAEKVAYKAELRAILLNSCLLLLFKLAVVCKEQKICSLEKILDFHKNDLNKGKKLLIDY